MWSFTRASGRSVRSSLSESFHRSSVAEPRANPSLRLLSAWSASLSSASRIVSPFPSKSEPSGSSVSSAFGSRATVPRRTQQSRVSTARKPVPAARPPPSSCLISEGGIARKQLRTNSLEPAQACRSQLFVKPLRPRTCDRSRQINLTRPFHRCFFSTASSPTKPRGGAASSGPLLTPKLVLRRDESVKRRFPHTLVEGQYAVLPAHPIPPSIPRPPYARCSTGQADRGFDTSDTPGEVQTPDALKKIRAAATVAANALKLGLDAAREGVTTEDLDKIVHQYIVSVGAYPAAVNFHNFPKAVCASVNEAVCHGIPDLRPLQDGDIVTLDCTAYVDGFFGDCAGTAMVGSVTEAHRTLVETTKDCLDEAIKLLYPGLPIKEVGRCITALAEQRGFSVVREFCGHFIGRKMHLPPLICHAYPNDTQGVFRVGQTFTIEPILCEGASDLFTWNDGWTIVTQDGGRAAQFEHTILMTPEGAEVLTKPTL
ncbi:putative methionine aminopeptidase, type i [Toxoplasma gondii GT1]|uniref:Methionine aminopeptidase n=4 Tax=Toxoplasma gondii TaxID=5811 RepID=S7WF72_TOXGG|nr:putative methionine aminopeptidase, type i [Toxoplasma gondii GT1]KAF4641409.1 putative methionine aminopeptidase, type i [Toxoplasma gondii]